MTNNYLMITNIPVNVIDLLCFFIPIKSVHGNLTCLVKTGNNTMYSKKEQGKINQYENKL